VARNKNIFVAIFIRACFCVLLLSPLSARTIFTKAEPVIDGLPVLEMSETFAEIFEKLESVKWGGKDIRIAIEAIENLHPDITIAATDRSIVILNRDKMLGTWARPDPGDWYSFGQITTAIVLKLREALPGMSHLTVPDLYRAVVTSMMLGVNEEGRYIFSRAEMANNDPNVLTSLGIAGVRTNVGDYVLNTIFRGSPAYNAGLEEGDIIISANGTPLRNLSDMEVLGLFNGFSSGTIRLRVVERASRRERNVTLRRATVIIADADIVMINPESADLGVLEIIIHRISENSVDLVAGALEEYRHRLGGILLDLRSATGDDEMALAKIAGLFLGEVPVARIVTEGGKDAEITPGGRAVIDVPIVVAVSNSTVGTAEGLAFAFYEQQKGVAIGVPTPGRSRLRTTINLSNGGALELLNRELRTGQNRQIDGRGFFPNVCLSNIRTSDQQDVFMVSIRNNEWQIRDFNNDGDVRAARRGCPNITSGADEDNVTSAVAMDILLNGDVYKSLMDKAHREKEREMGLR